MAGSARGGVAVFPPSTRQHGNIETCPTLNKKGSRRCFRIEVQSKETSTAPGVQLGLRDGGGRNARSFPWIGVDDPSEEQRLQADHATRVQESANFQFGGPEKLTSADDPQHALQKSGGVAVVHG